MKKNAKILQGAAMVAALALLVGCGEGTGGGTSPPAPSPPPAPAPVPPPPPPAPTFAIGGTVSGLAGGGVVLQNNSGDDLAVSANGSFTFAGKLATGAAYSVTIKTQPASPAQTCVVNGGSGMVAAANITSIDVSCAAVLPMAFKVGGTVSGLSGTLVLQNNGGDALTLSANGAFSFVGLLASGSNYSVAVANQPASQDCTVSNGSGTIAGADVSDVSVRCAQKLAVTSTTPADRAVEVLRDGRISIQFSADIDAASISDSSITLASASGAKRLQFATTASLVMLTPVGNLQPNAQYTLNINTAVRGAAGEKLASAVTRTFRTRDGQWGEPHAIQLPSSSGYGPQIAVDAAGDAVAIWADSAGRGAGYKPAANRYVAGSGWGTAVMIPAAANNILYPKVAMDAAGNAFAIWQDRDSITGFAWTVETSRYAAGTGWESAIGNTFTLDLEIAPQVAADANGNAFEVWSEGSADQHDVWVRQYIAGSGWQTDMLLEQEPGDARIPQIAFDKDGNAMAVWQQKAGGHFDIWARHYVPGAGWNNAELIEENDESWAQGPQVALDAAGNATVVWNQDSPGLVAASVWANHWDIFTGWGTAELIEHIDNAPGQFPRVAVDPAGDAIAVWPHIDPSRSETDIWSNRWVPGTGWGSERKIETQTRGDAKNVQVAVDVNGHAIAVWMEYDGTRWNVWANRYLPGPGWGTAQLLEHEDGYAGNPQIAIDPDGDAFAIWEQGTTDNQRVDIYVARFE